MTVTVIQVNTQVIQDSIIIQAVQPNAQYQWLAQQDLLTLDWAPADLPIVEELREHWDYFLGLT